MIQWDPLIFSQPVSTASDAEKNAKDFPPSEQKSYGWGMEGGGQILIGKLAPIIETYIFQSAWQLYVWDPINLN